MDSAHLEVLLV